MAILPTGTVTFLFTDIEGSTKLAREFPDEWETLRHRHHEILLAAMDAHQGNVFEIIGDAFCVAFSTAGEALKAAARAQIDLQAENWGEQPIKVRVGIHTGKAEIQDNGGYNGYLALSRVQRIMSAGSGGQTLISHATQELIRDELPANVFLEDLGEHRLKDLIRPENIFQLNINGLPLDFSPLKTLDKYRHNLPIQMTSFIGREKEMDEIKQAIAEHRLVTLTGAGGSGKTRLAMQVGADLLDHFSDGVWLIDLAPLSDPAFVPQAIADAIGVRQAGAGLLIDLLINYVHRRELLILLDNCEHLIEACARTADLLLKAGSSIKILATSREGLGLAGEKTFTVPSLSIAKTNHPSISALSQYEATRLFIDRALLVQPHFTVTNENAPAIAQICYRLDGIPLAIELAAARMKAMSPELINSRLDDSFRLLTGGNRTALPRQQTLRATIDWSWNLLSKGEQLLVTRLSVFAGGWTLVAAEAVGKGKGIDEYDIPDLLTQLVNKSLVVWQDAKGESRYLLLETIRQYTHAKLTENNGAEEENRVLQRHAEYFTEFAEQAVVKIYSSAQKDWFKRLDADQENLRAALAWAVDSKSPLALRITRPFAEYLFWRSGFAEGAQWIERALSANPEAALELRVYALAWASFFTDTIGQVEQAVQYGKAGLDLARKSQNKDALAFALLMRGVVSIETGDQQFARTCFEEALPLARATQSPFVLPGILIYLGEAYYQEGVEIARRSHASFWEAIGLWFSGHLAFIHKDIDKARAELVAALQLGRELENKNIIAHTEEMYGRVQILDANWAGARLSLSHSLMMLQDMASKPCLAHDLEGWARLALAHGEPKRAAQILGAIDAHMKNLGMNMIPLEQVLYDETQAAVQQQLNTDAYQQEWSAGEKLNLEQAIEFALS